jgi:hypothetical protein
MGQWLIINRQSRRRGDVLRELSYHYSKHHLVKLEALREILFSLSCKLELLYCICMTLLKLTTVQHMHLSSRLEVCHSPGPFA